MLLGRDLLIIVYFILVTLFGIFLKYTLFLNDLLCVFCCDNSIQTVYDYIVVGSGSAGSVIANRLASNKSNKILVLEAGRYGSELLHIPSMGLLLQKTPFDWNYETVPQKNACLALNKNVSIWPMGKILGGTSMLNNMLYVRGHQQDFDEWFRNKEGYNYLDVLAYFKKLENHASQENADVEDTEKFMYVQDLIFTTSLSDVFLRAARSVGYSVLNNIMNSEIGN